MKGRIRHLLFFGLIALNVVASKPAVACSPAPVPPTPREIFDRSIAVFRGTVISADLWPPVKAGAKLPEMFVVKVRWHVDEVYKGRDIKGRGALVQNICGGVDISVGAPYVFAVQGFDGPLPSGKIYWDLIGWFDGQGTVIERDDRYKVLVGAFEKLKQGK